MCISRRTFEACIESKKKKNKKVLLKSRDFFQLNQMLLKQIICIERIL